MKQLVMIMLLLSSCRTRVYDLCPDEGDYDLALASAKAGHIAIEREKIYFLGNGEVSTDPEIRAAYVKALHAFAEKAHLAAICVISMEWALLAKDAANLAEKALDLKGVGIAVSHADFFVWQVGMREGR